MVRLKFNKKNNNNFFNYIEVHAVVHQNKLDGRSVQHNRIQQATDLQVPKIF